MSIINECLRQILSARFGKDVRQSIHDGIKELDEVARTAQGSATLSAQTAIEKANEALTASQAAIESAQQAKAYSDNAQAVAGVQVATQDNAGLVKGGENHIGLDGTLELVVKTTEASMPNSRKGRLAVDEIGGVCVQDNIPSPELPQEIKKTVVSEIKTRRNNMFDVSKFETNQYINADGSVSANGAWGVSDYMLAKVPSITFSHKDDVWLQIVIAEYDGKKNFIRITTKQGFLPTVTQELSENTSYIRISYSVDVGNGAVTREEVMVNEGTIALPYEPYTESVITLSQPIELYAINGIQDKIVHNGDVWGVEKNIASATQNAFPKPTRTTDDGYWIMSGGFANGSDILKNTMLNAYKYFMCDKLPVVVQSNETTSGDAVVSMYGHKDYAEVRPRFKVDVYTADEAKAISDSATFYYPCIPSFEPLPLADQIALNSLETFDGATCIEFDSEVQPTFKGKYGASLVGGIALEAYNKAHTHSRTVLWTNSDKTQPIEARTVLLPLSLDDYEQYEFYLVTYCNSTASEFAEKQVLMARAAGTYNGNNVVLGAVIKEGDTYHQHERNLAYSFDSNAFTVAQCTYLDASFKAQAAHDKLIPYQIIGIK